MKIRLSTFKKTLLNWYANDPFSQAAAISYYTIFSFPALVIIYFSIASFFTTRESAKGQINDYLTQIVGENKTENIERIIEQTSPEYTSIWAFIIGGGILLFAALRLFLQLQTALNTIWRVKVKGKVSVWQLVKKRLAAFGVMLGILFILLVTLFITTILATLGEYIAANISADLLLLVCIINFIISLTIISVLFTILLRMLPDAEVGLRYAFAGGVFTAALFMLGQYLVGLYFNLAEPASAYGVTASIILLMLWVSYACVILLMGAEFTKTLQEENRKAPAKPNEVAVKGREKK